MPAIFDLIIKGGTVATPGGLGTTDIGVSHGRIAAIGSFAESQARKSSTRKGSMSFPA